MDAWLKWSWHPRSSWWRWLAYAGAVALFLWVAPFYYLPGRGFTYLVMFGDKDRAHFLPELQAVQPYLHTDSAGYDAQYYAQIAMRPRLTDPALAGAVDNLPYRARRILFCWTAWLVGAGDPARALHVFAVQNMAAWLLLGVVLLRWFPATSWGNFSRWAGVMFSFGLCFSVRKALLDGPSLLLIAVGLALTEARRPWLSALVLGASGLGKETSLLAGAGLTLPREDTVRAWTRLGAQGALVALPLAAWLAGLWWWLGTPGDVGLRNFDLPFASCVELWRSTLQQLRLDGLESAARWNVPVLLALTAQFLFFALRPRWREAWWRVGAAYALLMAFLGAAVWEGYPGAAARVLLPMLLAFNIAVPRGRGWWVLLLAGNLSILAVPSLLKPPGRESYHLAGPRALQVEQKTGRAVEVLFDENWYPPERSFWEYWRWARSSAGFVVRNPQPFALNAEIRLGLRSNEARRVRVRAGEKVMWEGSSSDRLQKLKLRIVLPPGDQAWRVETPEPPVSPGKGDTRLLAFSLRDMEIRLKARAGETSSLSDLGSSRLLKAKPPHEGAQKRQSLSPLGQALATCGAASGG